MYDSHKVLLMLLLFSGYVQASHNGTIHSHPAHEKNNKPVKQSAAKATTGHKTLNSVNKETRLTIKSKAKKTD